MGDDQKELTRAIYDLRTEVALNTQETKNQTEYFKTNGLADKIVNKLTKRIAVIMSITAALIGIILYVV